MWLNPFGRLRTATFHCLQWRLHLNEPCPPIPSVKKKKKEKVDAKKKVKQEVQSSLWRVWDHHRTGRKAVRWALLITRRVTASMWLERDGLRVGGETGRGGGVLGEERDDLIPVKSNEVILPDSYSQLTPALPIKTSQCICVCVFVVNKGEVRVCVCVCVHVRRDCSGVCVCVCGHAPF